MPLILNTARVFADSVPKGASALGVVAKGHSKNDRTAFVLDQRQGHCYTYHHMFLLKIRIRASYVKRP